MRKASVVKGLKNAHTSNATKGMGDFYGSGVKNKMGRILDGTGVNPLSKAKLKKPPRSLG